MAAPFVTISITYVVGGVSTALFPNPRTDYIVLTAIDVVISLTMPLWFEGMSARIHRSQYRQKIRSITPLQATTGRNTALHLSNLRDSERETYQSKSGPLTWAFAAWWSQSNPTFDSHVANEVQKFRGAQDRAPSVFELDDIYIKIGSKAAKSAKGPTIIAEGAQRATKALMFLRLLVAVAIAATANTGSWAEAIEAASLRFLAQAAWSLATIGAAVVAKACWSLNS